MPLLRANYLVGLVPFAANAMFIADRREAIRAALMLSPAGSTILLAGKGHEEYEIVGDRKRPFSEREIVAEVLKRKFGK